MDKFIVFVEMSSFVETVVVLSRTPVTHMQTRARSSSLSSVATTFEILSFIDHLLLKGMKREKKALFTLIRTQTLRNDSFIRANPGCCCCYVSTARDNRPQRLKEGLRLCLEYIRVGSVPIDL